MLFAALRREPCAQWASAADVNVAISEYLRWMRLRQLWGADGISRSLDVVWRAHVLETQAYAAFCERHFGGFVHRRYAARMRGASAAYVETLRSMRNEEDDQPRSRDVAKRFWPGLLEGTGRNMVGAGAYRGCESDAGDDANAEGGDDAASVVAKGPPRQQRE